METIIDKGCGLDVHKQSVVACIMGTRYEQKLAQTISSEKNRIQKILEDANIKLSSVVSSMSGVTATKIVEELLKGELAPSELCEFAKGRLTPKKEEIIKAVEGKLTKHHKLMIEASLEHIKACEKIIDTVDIQIDELLKNHSEAYELLQSIPGVKTKVAASIIAEIGTDMNQFPTENHLCSWAGIAPGNNESAGKKKSGKITKGSKSLKNTLTQAAWAASRTKDTYLSAKYKSLVGRRGKKRALIAVAHKILQIAYFIIKDKIPYKELGGNYLELRKEQTVVKGLTKRLQKLGYSVELQKEEEIRSVA